MISNTENNFINNTKNAAAKWHFIGREIIQNLGKALALNAM